MIEELQQERNCLADEVERWYEQCQEISSLYEQVAVELNQVKKRNDYLELANQNYQKTRRRLESKILELQQDNHVMKSTYNSRINGIGESSAGGVSCSAYESNRNFTQIGGCGQAGDSITNISPMAGGEPGSIHLNLKD